MRKRKIAVYTICKNEEAFVDRFMDCLVDEADMVIVADTGSEDNTVEKLKKRGAIVHEIKIDPWRFDTPRNVSMHLVPADVDICVCIDLDEVLSKGWRAEVEKAWTDKTTRLRYKYFWSFNADGSPATSFWYDKIHSRNGYLWRNAVHEVLEPQGIEEVQTFCDSFTLSHYPDQTKSRSSYLPLLELSTQESPNNDRNSHYLGREYMFYQMYDKAIVELKRHLSLPTATWKSERAASMRFIGRCYEKLNQADLATAWFLRSVNEAPGDREPLVELGKNLYSQGIHSEALRYFELALEIKERPASYICEPFAWNHEPSDHASFSAWQIGDKERSLKHAREARKLIYQGHPDFDRIDKNLKMLESLN